MSDTKQAPLIVAFVADLMFTTKIENVTRHLGFNVRWIEKAEDVGEVDPDAPPEQPGESLYGRQGKLFQKITNWQPALLLFDLTNEAVPWRRWMPVIKSSPSTRRIPIMAFGPHEDTERMTEAKRLGADAVYARSRFTAAMPDLLQKHARIPDHEALLAGCQEPLPPLAQEGITLFNQGQYYKCHDSLEEAWRQDERPGRELYQGILQVGIAIFQIQRGNYRGAVKMLMRVQQWLQPLPDVCRGVNVARLRQNVDLIQETVNQLGPDRLDEFDENLVQEIEYDVRRDA